MPRHKRTSMFEPQPPPVDVAKLELVGGFANLLNTGVGSDLTVTCNGMTFKVHKAILASRSSFFTTACWGNFREAQSNHIDLPDDDAVIVKKMLEYFYLLDYESDKDTGLCMAETDRASHPAATDLAIDEEQGFSTCVMIARLRQLFPRYGERVCLEALTQQNFDYSVTLHTLELQYAHDKCAETSSMNSNDDQLLVPELTIHASVHGIADKYGIQGLKSISMQKLKAALGNEGWNPDSQQSYTPKMIEELATAVQAAWSLTPESDNGLRAPLLDYALKNKEALLEAEGFKLVIQQTPLFAYDLLTKALIRKPAESSSPAVQRKKPKKRNLYGVLIDDL